MTDVCEGRSAAPEGGMDSAAVAASLKEVAEKVVVGEKSLPQALKRGRIFQDLAARLKSGPYQSSANQNFSAACKEMP